MRDPQLAQAHSNLIDAAELVEEADLYFGCPELKRRALLAVLASLADLVDLQTAPASRLEAAIFVKAVAGGILERAKGLEQG